MQAFWMGGASAPSTVVTIPGVRSMQAFWMGGACNLGEPIPPTPDEDVTGGWKIIEAHRRERERAIRRRAELRAIEDEIATVERQRLEAEEESARLATAKRRRKAALTRAALEAATLREQINALRMERVRLMRLIDDEEATLVLLLSMPFIH
jgi:hypothetical protein